MADELTYEERERRLEWVARLVNDGCTERQIAERTGYSRSTVWSIKQRLARDSRFTLRQDAFRR